MLPYTVSKAIAPQIPVIVSVPHCGTAFPEELKGQYKQGYIAAPDDTDWFVDRLYDFAPSLGITMITAHYSRWVIDLNRDPQSKPLYTDGRIITALCPTTDFLGNPLYVDQRIELSENDVKDRLTKYYWPYHEKLQQLLRETKEQFGKVLLWDCHSIRQRVPTIYRDKFPDLILGSDDEKSASAQLIDTALKTLGASNYQLNHNHPFKGGYITRAYGKPNENYHALQLEMSKVNYMDDSELKYDSNRAAAVRTMLKETFAALNKIISA